MEFLKAYFNNPCLTGECAFYEERYLNKVKN